MGEPELRRVEKWAWIFLAVAAAGSFLFGYQALAFGFALGGAISIFNFKWLGFFCRRVLPRGSRGVRFFAILIYVGRYLAVGAVLYFVISRGFVNGISLLVGVSIIYLVLAFFSFTGLGHRDRNCKEA